MSEIRLETLVIPRLARTPFCAFAALAWADMVRHSEVDLTGSVPFDPEHAAVVARAEPDTIGILTFTISDPACARIVLAWVAPDWRRRGVLRAMLDELVKWCERQGPRMIEAEVPIQDAGAAKALAACGLAVVAQRYWMEI